MSSKSAAVAKPVYIRRTVNPFGWQDSAACRDIGAEAFFPDKGPSPVAKATCDHCPVRAECLDYALAFERTGYLPAGIFGGLTGTERADLLAAERAEAA
jgi:WhiB family transcriptional regulator, redox-sensing transcriptional regulator